MAFLIGEGDDDHDDCCEEQVLDDDDDKMKKIMIHCCLSVFFCFDKPFLQKKRIINLNY